MDSKWFFLLVLILIVLGICGIVSHFSTAPAEFAAVADQQLARQVALQATIAAATPDTVELLNENRMGLSEYSAEANGNNWAWGLVIIFLALLDFALVAVLLMQNSEGTIKQVRLLQKQLGGGGRTRGAVNRSRTLPQIPYLTPPSHYRQLPTQHMEQTDEEADW